MNSARALLGFLLSLLGLSWAFLLPLSPAPGQRLSAGRLHSSSDLGEISPAGLREHLLLRLPNGEIVGVPGPTEAETSGTVVPLPQPLRVATMPGSAVTDGDRLAVMRGRDEHLLWNRGAVDGPHNGFPLIPPGTHALLDASGSVVTVPIPGADPVRVADAMPLSSVASDPKGTLYLGFASGALVSVVASPDNSPPQVIRRETGAPVLGIAADGESWIAVLSNEALAGARSGPEFRRLDGINPALSRPLRLAAVGLAAVPHSGESLVLSLPRLRLLRSLPGILTDSLPLDDGSLLLLRTLHSGTAILDLVDSDSRISFSYPLPGPATSMESDGSRVLLGYTGGQVQVLLWDRQ